MPGSNSRPNVSEVPWLPLSYRGEIGEILKVCTYVWMITNISRVWINRVRVPILLSWSAEQGKIIFPCPRSRLRIWSRETGSAVPSRVGLLIFILRLKLKMKYSIFGSAPNLTDTPGRGRTVEQIDSFHTTTGCGKKRGAHKLVHGDLQRQQPVTGTLPFEDYWPCAGGLSAVNAIGTQLRSPINSGLTRWHEAA